VNHRALQRTLFRMQHDPTFAERVQNGTPAACATTGLAVAELALLQSLDPAALSADRGGKRRQQFLRNVSSEFKRCVALGPLGDGDSTWIEAFPTSDVFHRAVASGSPLPRAFGAFATRCTAGEAVARFRSLVTLEVAMARARREPAARPAPKPERVALSPWAHCIEVPAGTHALAGALAELLEHGASKEAIAACGRDPGADPVGAGREVLLLVAPPDPPRPGSLRQLRVEPLAPLLAKFLRAHHEPLPRSAWARFAREHGLDRVAVEAVAADFLRDAILLEA